MANKTSIIEVASKAGVSRTTVSRVLNHSSLVKESTHNAVVRAIEELGYTPNELARGLRISATKVIGVIVTNVMNPFFTSIVRGVEDIAKRDGYSIILCNSDEDAANEAHYINMLLSRQVDGFIIASSGCNHSVPAALSEKPIVFVDRRPVDMEAELYDSVLVNNVEGSRLAVEQLIHMGFRKIGIITGSTASPTGTERLQGYKAALKENGIRIDNNLIKVSDFLAKTAYSAAIELISEGKCDAIFSANNLILNEVLKAAKNLHVVFNERMRLATFDDMEWMDYCESKIISVQQPTYEIGTEAMRLLLERLSGYKGKPREVTLDVKLIIR